MRRRLPRTIAIACVFAIASAARAQPWTAPSKIEITPEHVLSINGKKTFTIGLTGPPAPDAKTPSGRLALEEFRDAGAILVRPPIREDISGGAEWLARQRAYLDAAARAGMFCIVYLRELATIDRDRPQSVKALRQTVRALRNHPGMGVWKGADEPQWAREKVAPLLNAYRIVKEEDPHHPIWIVQAPRGTVEELRAYNPVYDITGVDVYPIAYPPGTHLSDDDHNKEISVVGDYTQKMLRVVEGRKPVWFTVQIAWSGVEGPKHTLRFPTFPQERFMAYQAIINGARGLIFFGGNLPMTLTARDEPLGWNWTFWERVLRPVIEEIGTKSPLATALGAPNSNLPVKSEGSAIELCVREVGRELFVLACCRDPQKTAEVRFTGLPNDVGDAEVLYESPRRITAKHGSFTDWFAPYDVHVYKFTRQ
jgi:hypothetical protein